MPPVSRRRLLAMGAATTGALFAGALGAARPGFSGPVTGSEPFYGRHQAGIAAEQQDRLRFAALDLTTTGSDDVKALLTTWTAAAGRMVAGLDAVEPDQRPLR